MERKRGIKNLLFFIFKAYIKNISKIVFGGDNDMSKISKEDIKIIVKYKNNVDEKEDKTLQKLMQKLFNSYIIKAIQNIRKGK